MTFAGQYAHLGTSDGVWMFITLSPTKWEIMSKAFSFSDFTCFNAASFKFFYIVIFSSLHLFLTNGLILKMYNFKYTAFFIMLGFFCLKMFCAYHLVL